MKIEQGLNPNCSEIVFRFNGLVKEVDTASYETIRDFIKEAAEMLKKDYTKKELLDALKNPNNWGLTAKFYENMGGGGDWDVIRQACWLSTQVALNKVSLDEANEMISSEKKIEMIEEEY